MRVIQWNDRKYLTDDERLRLRSVTCGPDCPYCGEPNKGIAVATQLDYFGDVYPEATGVIRGLSGDWIVYGLDPDAPYGQKELARYPSVAAIRNLPAETQLYGHTVLDEEEA